MIKRHPFGPLVFSNTKILLIGTLPPETATFYFSNSSNTRLWDILRTISLRETKLLHDSVKLSPEEKEIILRSLGIGIYDIIEEYERTDWTSTKDEHIIPYKYSEIDKLVASSQIEKVLFVYANAAKWFMHAITGESPKMLRQLNIKLENKAFYKIERNDRLIPCILLPSPLNRGRKGETLEIKLECYRNEIID